MKIYLAAIAAAPLLLAACGESPEDQAEDAMEEQAEASALGSGAMPVALGLTEAELLDADIYGPDASGSGEQELGEVIELRRDAQGMVDALLIEIEDSDPDRFVELPVEGLETRREGDDDVDLISTMTRADLAELPDVDITAQPSQETPPA